MSPRAAAIILLTLVGIILQPSSRGANGTWVVTGQWDFENGDLRATVGTDLEFLGDTASITTFPSLDINGQTAHVMAFGSNSITQGFYMRHGAAPNGGGHFVNQYTLLMDIMFP